MSKTKADLVKIVAKEVGLQNYITEQVITSFLKNVKEAVFEDGKVQLIQFGIFKVNVSNERNGRNPKTGEPIIIASKKTMKFKAS
jgi:DNA-binding protein HU-beta